MSADHTAIELNACFMNPQNVLAEAVQKGDLRSFEEALRRGAAPDIEDPKVHLSVFEKLCRTKGSGDFIRLCIKHSDVDVNKLNGHLKKAPINLVAETKSYENLEALLTAAVDVNQMANNMTPLLKLAQSVTNETSEELYKCIKLLLEHGANPNIPNQQNITPIIALLNRVDKLKNPDHIVQLFLTHPRIDLDSHRQGEARQLLNEYFPHLQLPGPRSNEPVTYEKLRQLLKNELEDVFLQEIRDANAKDVVDADRSQDDNLLIAATENGLCGALNALVQMGADVNAGGKKCPLKLACQRGEWKILEQLLHCDTINLAFNKNEPLLCIIVKKLGEKGLTNRCDYHKCFNILIEESRIDVNEVDMVGSTALHYAVKYKNESAIKALLQRSAYIGVEDRFKDIAIVDINGEILKKHFDDCITANNHRPGDINYQIGFDYSNLAPLRPNTAEMAPLTFIAKNPELRHLMKHPLISSFLFLKWQRLSILFYINLILYFLFSISLIGYSVFCYGHDVSKEWALILWTVSVIGGIYVLLRELFQFFTAPQIYFCSVENWIEIIMMCLSALVLSDVDFTEPNRRFVAASLILLLALEFAVLVGALPILSFSTHMVMLKTVFTSLLKSLAFYSIILVSFALCFYTLLGGSTNSNPTNAGNAQNSTGDGDFNKFVSPGMAILKTVVMMTGEFDAGSIELGSPSSYGIFLLFVIFISIVLFNLLNGLAVSDTKQIKDEAELMGLIGRAELLARFERTISRDTGNFCSRFVLQNSLFDRLCKRRISLFPDTLPGSQIKLLPNDRNKIVVPTRKDLVGQQQRFKNSRSQSEESLVVSNNNIENGEQEQNTLGCCLIMERCTRLDGGIAKQAHAVLARKQFEQERDNEKRAFKKRIIRLEEKLDQILTGLSDMQKRA